MINTSCNIEYAHLIIMGDFNYPKLDWNSWTSNGDKEGDLIHGEYQRQLPNQHILGYTRTTDNSEPGTIDLVFTNEENTIDKIEHESPLERSDHIVLFFKYKCYFELEEATVDK